MKNRYKTISCCQCFGGDLNCGWNFMELCMLLCLFWALFGFFWFICVQRRQLHCLHTWYVLCR